MDKLVLRNLQGMQVATLPYDAASEEPILPRIEEAIRASGLKGAEVHAHLDDWSAGVFHWGPLAGTWELCHSLEQVPDVVEASYITHIFEQAVPLARVGG
jgi:hypothetical protein